MAGISQVLLNLSKNYLRICSQSVWASHTLNVQLRQIAVHSQRMHLQDRNSEKKTFTWLKFQLQKCLDQTGVVPGQAMEYFTETLMRRSCITPDIACLLFSHLGKACLSLDVKRKQILMNKILDHVTDKRLEVYNAMLQAMIESKIPFSTDTALKELETLHLKPNQATLAKLIANQCLEGNLSGAYNTAKYMKSVNMTLSSECFANLAWGNCIAGKTDIGKMIFEFLLENKLLLKWQNVTTICSGFARAGEIDAMMELLEEYCQTTKTKIPFANLVEIFVSLKTFSAVEKSGTLGMLSGELSCAEILFAAQQLDYFEFDGVHELLHDLYGRCKQKFDGKFLFSAKCYLWHLIQKAEDVSEILKSTFYLQSYHHNTDLHYIALEQLLHYQSPLSKSLVYELKSRGIEIKPHMIFPLFSSKPLKAKKELLNEFALHGLVFSNDDMLENDCLLPGSGHDQLTEETEKRLLNETVKQTTEIAKKYFMTSECSPKDCAKSFIELWKDVADKHTMERFVTMCLLKETIRHPLLLPKFIQLKKLLKELYALHFAFDLAVVEEFYNCSRLEIDFALDLFWNTGASFPQQYFDRHLQFAYFKAIRLKSKDLRWIKNICEVKSLLRDMQYHIDEKKFASWVENLEVDTHNLEQSHFSLLFWHYVKTGNYHQLQRYIESLPGPLKQDVTLIPAEYLQNWSTEIETLILDCLSGKESRKDAVFTLYLSFLLADKPDKAQELLKKYAFSNPSKSMMDFLISKLSQKGQLLDKFKIILKHFHGDKNFSKMIFVRNVVYSLAQNGQADGALQILEEHMIEGSKINSGLQQLLSRELLAIGVMPSAAVMPNRRLRKLVAMTFSEDLDVKHVLHSLKRLVNDSITIPVPVMTELFLKLPPEKHSLFLESLPKELGWFDPFLQSSVVISTLRSLLDKKGIDHAVAFAWQVLRPVDDNNASFWSSALELLCDFATKHKRADVLQTLHAKMFETQLSELTNSYQLYCNLSRQKQLDIEMYPAKECINYFVKLCQRMQDKTTLDSFLQLPLHNQQDRKAVLDMVVYLIYHECDIEQIGYFMQKWVFSLVDYIQLCKSIYKDPKDFVKLKAVDTIFRDVSPTSSTLITLQNLHLFGAIIDNGMEVDRDGLEYLRLRYFSVPSYMNGDFVTNSFNLLESGLVFGNTSDVQRLFAQRDGQRKHYF